MAVTLPIVNGSEGVWGTILNAAITDIDNRVVANATKGTTHDSTIATLTSTTQTHTTQITNNTNAITALDGRIDTLETGTTAPRIYSQLATVPCNSGQTLGSVSVSFPGGTFSSTPIVVATINTSATANERGRYISRVHGASTGGVTVEITRGDGVAFTTTSSVGVCVIAHQNG